MWSGPFGMLLFGAGCLAAHFLPPPSPRATPDQIAHLFRTHTGGIKLGTLLMAFGGAFLGPWVAGLAVQLKRIEGRSAPLTAVASGLGILVVLEVIFPAFSWQVAAFRASDSSPESVRILNDLAWMPICGLIETVFIEALAVGFVLLGDRRPNPAYPRWAGHYCIASAVAFLPAALCVFFKSGVFAWDGLVAWWFVVSIFGLWQVVMTVLTLKAIRRQEIEATEADPLVLSTV